MPKDGLPTGEDFILAVATLLIMQDALLEIAKLLEAAESTVQEKACAALVPASLASVRFKLAVVDKLDQSKMILAAQTNDLLQFADPPEPEVVQ